MYLHLFKKNPNQLCPEKIINKHANTLDVYYSSQRDGVNIKLDINIFWGENIFLKRNKQGQTLICFKNCEINNFLAILVLSFA